MKRIIKFPLIMDNGKEVRTINELRENFNLEKVIEYYIEGKLKTWLQHRNYIEELSQLEKLECCDDRNEIPLMLCKIFDVEQWIDLNISEIERRKSRLSILKKFLDDEVWEEKIEFIAFNQEELEKKLLLENLFTILDYKSKKQSKEVYLCGEMFTVTDKFKDITYIGVNTPMVKIVSNSIFDGQANNIKFENVNITSDTKINARIKDYKSCIIDFNKVNLKSINNIKYCKIFAEDLALSIVVDNMGSVHTFGYCNRGENHIPKFDAPIIDIDCKFGLVVAVDKNGKVYEWGDLPYRCQSVPKNLPKIKQVAVAQTFIVVLDEFGKLHWWGRYRKIPFMGERKYERPIFESLIHITSKIVQVICTSNIVMALDENGKVYSSMGYVSLGTGETIHNIPENLPFIKKIALLSAVDSALALDEYGKVHFWGKDEYGNCNIPKELPYIVDISEFDVLTFSVLDENGKIYTLGKPKDQDYDAVKKIPRLKHLVCKGGIDENGYMYNTQGILFNGLKVMLPNE